MSDIDDAIQYLQTIRDFIRWGASRMNEAGLHFGHGTAHAIDEAAALVLHGLHLPPDLHREYLQAVLTPAERQIVSKLLERRLRERKPAAYITNQAWFMGLPFYVDYRVLVPRSPIVELIENQFIPWLNPDRVERILDLCTGSGCIGIACAYVFPNACVDLVDISPDALEVARLNVRKHGLDEQVRVIQSDLFTALTGDRYDLIVSNPPYVSTTQMEALPEEYQHEPTLAFEAGEQGLDVISRILRQAIKHLNHNGILVAEVGNARQALSKLFHNIQFFWLELEGGGEGVFLITAEQLHSCKDLLD